MTSIRVDRRCTASQGLPRFALLAGAAVLLLSGRLDGQDYVTRRAAALAYIESHSDREQKVMIPMRDGVRLSALLFFPKDGPRQRLPAVLIRTPYLIEPGTITSFAVYFASLLGNGYAIVIQNVRGRYFSEGDYTFLVGSEQDGYDTVDWIARQPWSNGKVGALGCSSSAEEQFRLNHASHPAFAASVPMGAGAGIGKVGPYNEQGNFYRGGAVQTFWFPWYYGAGVKYRPRFSPDLPRETLIRLGRFWNLEPDVPPSGLDTMIWTLPLNRIMQRIGAAPSDLDEFVNRLPNDSRWRSTEFGGEAHRYPTPTLMINSWYDISVGPNVALYEHLVKHAPTEYARTNMFMVIAPTTHCQMGRVEGEHTKVGERDLGDARFDYVHLVQQWFDHFLKGVDNSLTRRPKVQAYMMGINEWRSYDVWPPRDAQPVTYYLDSDGGANSRFGNGRLTTARPGKEVWDRFRYDPRHPVPSLGGGLCCFEGDNLVSGAFDQSAIEARHDVLVYTTAPLKEAIEIAGPVQVSLYLSSNVKDTDLTVKLIDVTPEGKAYNLDESIQRVRWREGWDAPVFMEPGKVYRVDVGPLVTSNAFLPGHRIRIEVSSSNFPRFERNLNTGGNNFDEQDGVAAHNRIHHGPKYSSHIVLPVLSGQRASAASQGDR